MVSAASSMECNDCIFLLSTAVTRDCRKTEFRFVCSAPDDDSIPIRHTKPALQDCP